MSRVAGGEMLFGDVEKEAFRKIMRRLESFSGGEVLTYAVMGNHFHLLLRVPERAQILAKFEKGTRAEREARLLDHLKSLYSRAYPKQLKAELEIMTEQGMDQLYEETIQGFLDRMGSLKHFMKEFKERFSRWFNKRHGLRGTLWEDRFHSVIVQGGLAARTMAAYLDLNPVRAGMCADPADYRWSSYGEAVGGGRGAGKARSGLVRALRGLGGHAGTSRAWAQGGLSKEYRKLLLTDGTERTVARAGMTGAFAHHRVPAPSAKA